MAGIRILKLKPRLHFDDGKLQIVLQDIHTTLSRRSRWYVQPQQYLVVRGVPNNICSTVSGS